MTDGFFHLLRQNIQVGETITATFSSVTRIFTAYILLLTVINFIVFTWLFIRSPRHRWPVILMASGQVAARLVLLSSTPSLDARFFNIPAVALPYITYAIALFGFHIFDPISLARESAIEQLSAGMLVLNLEDQVMSLNPAAERVLGLSGSRARGQYIQHVLPVDPGDLTGFHEGRGMEISLPLAEHLKPGERRRDFTLTVSQLKDFRRLPVGSLLMLQDVTEQKQAQVQILEQQRAMAIQDERERLAREMHDSLGQTLAATHLLARSAKTLLEQDKTAQAEKCLDQISDLTLAAEADVREYLLGARLTIAAGQRFFEILRQYLVYFSQQYGLHVRLIIPPYLESEGLSTAVEMQLLRIIQEALTNIRKHAQAQSTQVIFTDSDHFVQIAIIDDGQGFDPAAVAGQTQGFGLQSMRERVESLGGCLEITSQPGQGTQVLVQIKREADSREKVVQ
jgi:PAS domain S-box-containing protein